MQIIVFWFKFDWNLFARVQLTVSLTNIYKDGLTKYNTKTVQISLVELECLRSEILPPPHDYPY